MKNLIRSFVLLSITLPLQAGWLVAKDFTQISYSSKPSEGYATFDEALKEMADSGRIQKLDRINGFDLFSEETFQKELFAGLERDAPRELREARASSGNMHNPKMNQLWKPFAKALLATPTISKLNASLALHGLAITDSGVEKFELRDTPTDPRSRLHGMLYLSITKSGSNSSAVLLPGEVPWTPETPYCYDRRQSASEDNPSPWDSDPELDRVEYRLVYLMEADRCAKKLRKSAKLPEAEAVLLYGAVDHLDEILEMSYHDAIKGFRTKPNPTLLLMMLYHYDAYVKSAMERWAPTIEALHEIDPVITKRAENLTGSEKELEFKSPTK